MTTELRIRNQSQQLYVRALTQALRNGVQTYDPSIWLVRDPEAEEKMLRDPDIAHAVGYRRHLIAGRQWAVVPRRQSARAPIAVAIASELLEGIRRFTAARFALARAFFSGARYARIHGTPKVLTIGDGRARTWWVPTRIEDMDKRLYRIVPDVHGEDVHAHWERWSIEQQKFLPLTVDESNRTIKHVYNDEQGSLGYGSALREALGWVWYAKTNVAQESMTAVERYAGGILAAKINGARDANTGLPNEELIAAWQATLEKLRARHVLVFDKEDEVEVIQGNDSGSAVLDNMRAELRSTIFTLVLGANLTTSADKSGSFALADVQENSTEALVQYDREIMEETLTDDLIGCVWTKNRRNLIELGIADEMPRYSITQEKREDPVQRANVANVLHTMGVALPLEEVLEQAGFRKPEDGEETVEGSQPQGPPMGGTPGLPFRAYGDAPAMFEVRHAPKGRPDGGQFLPEFDTGGGSKTGDDPTEKPPSAKPAKRRAVAGEMGQARREGKSWVMGDGSPLPDHLRGVNIPPGLTNVRVATDPHAELLARGFDAKGREKRVYSDSYSMHQAGAKFARIRELMGEQRTIKGQIDKALATGDDNAAAAALIFATGIRPGSERDTGGKVKAYGATTLEGRHVIADENGVRLDFIGKEGVHLQIPVEDPEIAKMLIQRAAASGPDGKLFGVSDNGLRDWTKSNVDSGRFTPKDFRTLRGTSSAIIEVNANPERAATLKEYKAKVMAVAKKVSALLGNTPAMALKAYIDPNVFAAWSPA